MIDTILFCVDRLLPILYSNSRALNYQNGYYDN